MTVKECKLILHEANQSTDVFFDCFDTLLGRRYGYDYAFVSLADYLIQNYQIRVDIDALAKGLSLIFDSKRSIVEASAAIIAHYKLSGVEAIDLCPRVEQVLYLSEKRNVFLLPHVEELLTKLQLLGKTIHVITDFYLPGADVLKLLNHCLRRQLVSSVFSSCEMGFTKSSGRIFDVIPQFAGSLMVGDNITSDIDVPKTKGARTVLVASKKVFKETVSRDRQRTRCDYRFLRSLKIAKRKIYAANFAFLIFDFCKRLYSQSKEGDLLHFCAREGQFLKRAFDLYIDKRNQKKIKTSYFPVSRLALVFPTTTLEACHERAFFDEICDGSPLTWEDFLFRLGFETKEIVGECRLLSVKRNEHVFFNSFIDAMKNPAFSGAFATKHEESKRKLWTYLSNADNRFVLVDVGWGGSMQDRLRSFFPANINLIGYYISLTSEKNETINNRKIGLISDLNSNTIVSAFSTEMSFLESLLRADHGLLVNYAKEKDHYINDSSLNVYKNYSSTRQSEMINIILKLCERDAFFPISKRCLSAIEARVFFMWPVLTLCKDLEFEYKQLTIEGSPLNWKLKLGYAKDAMARRWMLKREAKKRGMSFSL